MKRGEAGDLRMFQVVEPSTSSFFVSHCRFGTSNNTTKDFEHQNRLKRPLAVPFFVPPIGRSTKNFKETVVLRLFLHYPILRPRILGVHCANALHMVGQNIRPKGWQLLAIAWYYN